MGTRALIVIRVDQHEVTLYRGMDGYPAETGGHLLQALVNRLTQGDEWYQVGRRLLVDLLAVEDRGNSVYDVVSPVCGNSDAQHVYRIAHRGEVGYGKREWMISHVEIAIGDTDRTTKEHGAFWHTLPAFVEIVNANRAAINRNITARYGTEQQECELYPMLELPESLRPVPVVVAPPTVYDNTIAVLIARQTAITTNPASKVGATPPYIYNKKARRKLDAIGWAIRTTTREARIARGEYVNDAGYTGKNGRTRKAPKRSR